AVHQPAPPPPLPRHSACAPSNNLASHRISRFTGEPGRLTVLPPSTLCQSIALFLSKSPMNEVEHRIHIPVTLLPYKSRTHSSILLRSGYGHRCSNSLVGSSFNSWRIFSSREICQGPGDDRDPDFRRRGARRSDVYRLESCARFVRYAYRIDPSVPSARPRPSRGLRI